MSLKNPTLLIIEIALNDQDRFSTYHAQHSVHPTGGSLRGFKHFARLEVGSVKMALSCPAHLPLTPTVGQPIKSEHEVIQM